jgi:hypothetical protein
VREKAGVRSIESTPALYFSMKERGKLDLSECFIDGFFVVAKRGAGGWKDQVRKGTKVMAVADRSGLPIAIHIAPAAPQSAPQWYEITLVEATLASRFILEAPQRLIGDRAYDSDPALAYFHGPPAFHFLANIRPA